MSEPGLHFDAGPLDLSGPRPGSETYTVLRAAESPQRNANYRKRADPRREARAERNNVRGSASPFHRCGGASGSRGPCPPDFVAANCHGSARVLPNVLKATKPDQTPPPENFYGCPACGEMVDKTDRESIRLHHDHVLRPFFYRFAMLPASASDSIRVNRLFSDKGLRERSESRRARI
jgi:hypothetical protein